MREIVFLVEALPEGGLTARAVGEAIFTEAGPMRELRAAIREAVLCHFDEGMGPERSRVEFVGEGMLGRDGPTGSEARLLDETLEQYQRDGDFGMPWREVLRASDPKKHE